MTEQQINQRLDELNSLKTTRSVSPKIPITIILQEAEDLFQWCTGDKEILIHGGLDWNLVDDLPLRIGALRQIQSKWNSERKNYQECQKEWKVAAPEAFDLRNVLVHYFYHALYNNPVEYAKVKRIDAGASFADMIQDLSDLAALGTKHAAALEAIGLDLKLLDKARTSSFALAGLLGKVNGAQKESSPEKETRNRAYSHLKEAVDEIRRVGQFAFWKNPSRLRGYSSLYMRRLNETRKRKIETNNPESQ